MSWKRNLAILKIFYLFSISGLIVALSLNRVLAQENPEFSSLIQTLEKSWEKKVSYLGVKIVVNYSSSQPDVKSIRIVHGPAAKEKREVFFLKEKKSQIILDDGQYVWHYIPSQAFIIRSKTFTFLENLIEDLKEREELIQQNYKIYLDKQVQIMNRMSISIFFEPKGVNRPARKVWIDKEYGIPLRTEIYGLNGELVLLSTFSEIQFGTIPENDSFALKIPEGTLVKTLVESRYTDFAEAQNHVSFKLYSPSYLPKGFTLIGITHFKGRKGERVHLLYSDGLSSLSIFQDTLALASSGSSLPTREVDIRGKQGVFYDQGLLKILSWKLKDIHVTLIGEVSEDELLKVAASILP